MSVGDITNASYARYWIRCGEGNAASVKEAAFLYSEFLFVTVSGGTSSILQTATRYVVFHQCCIMEKLIIRG
jgi:hypothetical protein